MAIHFAGMVLVSIWEAPIVILNHRPGVSHMEIYRVYKVSTPVSCATTSASLFRCTRGMSNTCQAELWCALQVGAGKTPQYLALWSKFITKVTNTYDPWDRKPQ